MDKYTKALRMMIQIPIGVFCILVGLGFIGVSVWVSTFSDVASMIFLASLLGGGALINFGVGYAFLGDEYKATHFVRDGRTVFTPQTTPKFLQRRKLVTLIGAIAYALLAVYYVVRTILVNVYMGYLEDVGYNYNIFILIFCAVVALFVAVFFLLLHLRTKHIDLGEEE